MTEGYVDVDGGRLFYEAAGEGRTVVLIHPGLWDCRTWDDQFDVFAERFRTVRYDVRGNGKSSRPEAEYSYVGDLKAVFDQLDIDRAAIVGVSIGGHVAVDFTLEYPDRVDALVPVAAGVSGLEETPEEKAKWEKVWTPIEEAVEAGEVAKAIDMELEVWAPLGTDDPVGSRIRQIAHENAEMFADMRPLAQGIERKAAKRLGEIRVPTLVVLGAQDVPEVNQRWVDLGPQIAGSRTVTIDQADHVVNMRQPQQFNELVLAFLEELP